MLAQVENFSTGRQKKSINLYIFFKKYLFANCSCGHIQCSFDNTAETLPLKDQNFYGSKTKKMVRGKSKKLIEL